MRHLHVGRKLNRTASHRKAMLGNLAVSILDKERVVTTVPKAKEVRRVVERLITYGKRGGLHNIRLAGRTVKDKTVLKKLFDDIAPALAERPGGYTRIIKLHERKGDNAPLSMIELVGREGSAPDRGKKKKQRKQAVKKSATSLKKTVTKDADVTDTTPVQLSDDSAVNEPDDALIAEDGKADAADGVNQEENNEANHDNPQEQSQGSEQQHENAAAETEISDTQPPEKAIEQLETEKPAETGDANSTEDENQKS